MNQTISWSAAKAAGLRHYFTGLPCPHGHFAERFVSTRACTECLKVHLLSSRAVNPGKHSAYRIAAYYRHREKFLTEARDYHVRNRDTRCAKQTAWWHANPEYGPQWNAANRDKRRAHYRAWRGRKLSSGGSHTLAESRALLVQQDFRCANCAACIKAHHQEDHIMPLKLGGSDWISNIQFLCRSCNARKGAKHPDVFARQEAARMSFADAA